MLPPMGFVESFAKLIPSLKNWELCRWHKYVRIVL